MLSCIPTKKAHKCMQQWAWCSGECNRPVPTLVWWFKNVPPFTNLRIQYFGEPM